MVATLLSQYVSQILGGVLYVGEVDRPIRLAWCSNSEKGCVCACSAGNVGGGIQKLLIDSLFQHWTELRLMERSLSFPNLFHSLFIDIYPNCPYASGREGCGRAQTNIAHSYNRYRIRSVLQVTTR